MIKNIVIFFVAVFCILGCAFRSNKEVAFDDLAIASLIDGIKELSILSAETPLGYLRYDTCQESAVYIDADVLGGKVYGNPGLGCVRACMNNDEPVVFEYRCKGSRSGLVIRYVKGSFGTILIPKRGAYPEGDTTFSISMTVGSPFYRCFIVPFANSNEHLLIRMLKQPDHAEFRTANINDITSIHLIGSDLETMIQMRFEKGKEYFVSVFKSDGLKKTVYAFQREAEDNSIQLKEMKLGQLKSVLKSTLQKYKTPPEPKMALHFESKNFFIWEERILPLGYRGGTFGERIYFDVLRPFPIEE
jgi:hypothetical protein